MDSVSFILFRFNILLEFRSFTLHLDIITSFIYPTECTTRLFWKNVKTYIKIYIKMLLHVSV